MYNLNLTYPADQWIHRGEQISDFMSRLLDLYLLFYLLFINLKKIMIKKNPTILLFTDFFKTSNFFNMVYMFKLNTLYSGASQ